MSHRIKQVPVLLTGMLAAAWLTTTPGSAQDSGNDRQHKSAQQQSVRAVDSASWRQLGFDKIKGAAADPLLSVLSEEGLRALVSGENPALIPTLDGRTVAALLQDIGSNAGSLVMTPIAPCRIIDTRLAGGAFAANQIRNYDLVGPTNYATLGGNAAGCGIPGVGGTSVRTNTTRALVLNIVAVGAQGPGDFRAWPTNQPEPLASVINYANVSGLNIANSIALQTCDATCNTASCEPCPTGDLSFHADVSGTHLVVDVVGYFTAATGLGASSEGTSGQVDLLDNACHTITSCALTNSGNAARSVVVIGTSVSRVDHITGGHDEIVSNISTTAATCATGFPVTPGSGKTDITSAHPSGCCIEGSMTAVGRFTLAAGATQTYYLNAFPFLNSNGTTREIEGAAIECMILNQ